MQDSSWSRCLSLEGIENFRDFGGYRTLDGRRVATGTLWRSAHHGAATSADLESMGLLNLATVVDLRRPAERAAQPSQTSPGFKGQMIVCDQGDLAEAPHVAFLRETDLSPESARAFFYGYYEKAPFEPRHLSLFRDYFSALARPATPVLIHCTAGKDRTGLLAALTHHLLGVHADDIVDDFVLTNQAARLEERLPTVSKALAQSLGKVPSDAAVRAFLGVDAAYLTKAFDAIRSKHGSIEVYMANIGVGVGVTERLRDLHLI
jgi:protein-tyrosine phosphatase